MSRRLYDLAGDDAALEALLLEVDGEITPEAEALIAEHMANLADKVDSYSGMVTDWLADAEKFKAESQRLAMRARTLTNGADRMKARMLDALTMMGRDKIAGERFTVSRQVNPRSVEVLIDPAGLPDGWVRVVPESRVADKAAMKDALKHNDPLMYGDQPVARLAEPTYSLRIR